MAAILAVRAMTAPAFTVPTRRSPQIRPTLLPRWQSGGTGQALACVWTVQQDETYAETEAGSRWGKASLRLIRS